MAISDGGASPGASTRVERISDRELVVTRTIDGPAHLVFEAWAGPELFQRWWAPRSFGVSVVSYDADVRTGGTYRLVMRHHASERTMTFHGRYIEVAPASRLVWTNEEGDGEGAVTTATFEQIGEATVVTVSDLYPSKEALDEAVSSGSTSGWAEQFEQLDDLLALRPADIDLEADGGSIGTAFAPLRLS